MKKLIIILSLLFLGSSALTAEKIYTRNYSYEEVLTAYELTNDIPDKGVRTDVSKELLPELHKWIKSELEYCSEKTQIKLDERKRIVEISSDLKTIYGIINLFGESYHLGVQTKFNLELIEVINNKRLLKVGVNKLSTAHIAVEPKDNVRVISKLDVICSDHKPVLFKSGGINVKIDSYSYPIKSAIPVLLDLQISKPIEMKFTTAFSVLDKGSQVFQIQSKGEGTKNLYLIVSADFIDNNLMPIERLLISDVEKVRKELSLNKDSKRLLTRSFAIEAGMLEITHHDGRRGLGGQGNGLGGLDVDESDIGGPSFSGYFKKKAGVKLGKECKISFSQGSMKLFVTASKEDLLKIEKHMKEIRYKAEQRKVHFQLIEVEKGVLVDSPEEISPKYLNSLHKVKTLENLYFIVENNQNTVVEESESKLRLSLKPKLKKSLSTYDLAFYYSKAGVDTMFQKTISLGKDKSALVELTAKNGKRYFVLISEHQLKFDSKYWYR